MQSAVKTLRLVTDQPPGELEILFRAHHGRVFRTAQRITGSAADAEDVLQTVFLRLMKGQGTYDLSQNAEAYLSRAAINASLDLLRSRTRAKSVGLGRQGRSEQNARQDREAGWRLQGWIETRCLARYQRKGL